MIASFGSGATRIDVRAAEPGGAAAYETALRADLAARMSAGSQLLRNNRIHFTAQDAAQLRAGQVDTRLLATLAALSSQYPFSVTAFGDASPGVAVLYREVTITAGGKNDGRAHVGPGAGEGAGPALPARAGRHRAPGRGASHAEHRVRRAEPAGAADRGPGRRPEPDPARSGPIAGTIHRAGHVINMGGASL